MGDKGEGGVKNLKKWLTSFMGRPLSKKKYLLEPSTLLQRVQNIP